MLNKYIQPNLQPMKIKKVHTLHPLLRIFFSALILVIIPVLSLSGQETTLQVYPRFGVGIGFFHPADVNDYIKTDLDNIGYINEYGTEDLFMYYDLQGSLTFRLKNLDFSGDLGYAIAPKLVLITNGENQSYIFRRVSPGISCNVYVPTGKGRHAFFAGAGANISFMKFKEFTATSPGLRLQAGMSLMFGKFNLQPHLAFNYCKKVANRAYDGFNPDFTLNFTGVQFGVLLSSHSPVVRN